MFFRRALLSDPNDAETAFMFASFLDRTGDKKGAEVLYLRAIELDPGFIDALKGFGDCLSDQGRFQESEKMYLLAREASRVLGVSGEVERPHEVAKAFLVM